MRKLNKQLPDNFRLAMINIIACASFLLSSGCYRNNVPLTYEEALPLFAAGMSKDDILQAIGDPLFVDFPKSEVWFYRPSDTYMSKMKPGDEWSGFTIEFKNDTATYIRRMYIVVR